MFPLQCGNIGLFTQHIYLITLVSSYFAESDFLSLHHEWECRLWGLRKKSKPLKLCICCLSFRWWPPQISEWDPNRPRKTAFFGFATAGTAANLTHSPQSPLQVVSVWLSSRHWTLTWGPDPHRSPMLTRNCLLLFLWILVDEGSVFSLRPPLPPLGRSRTGREHARSLVGPMRNGAAGFQRVKRGWVWNQFFVLEEYMGSDPQYVGKVRGLIFSVFYGAPEVINHVVRSLGEIELVVNGGSSRTWGR